MEKQARIGTGVMILKGGKVLLGKRLNSHGAGGFSFPGGRLEHMESIDECAIRETKEECGLHIKNLEFLCVIDKQVHAPEHYVTLILKAEWESGEPEVLESNKCEGWGWYELDNLPEPMFDLSLAGIESYKTGKNYFKS